MADNAAAAAATPNDTASAALVAGLTHEDVAAVVAALRGTKWQPVVDAVAEEGLDGETLSDHMATPAILAAFFNDQVECRLKALSAGQLHRALCKRAAAKTTQAVTVAALPLPGGEGGGGGGGGGAAPLPFPAAAIDMLALRVRLTRPADDVVAANGDGPTTTSNIMVEVPRGAPVPVATRCILDHMDLSLSTPLRLTHTGRLISAAAVVDWAGITCLHAHENHSAGDEDMTVANAATHCASTEHVRCGKDDPHFERPPAGNTGWCLDIFDAGDDDAALGRGTFGAVFRGRATCGRRVVPVAVKKFYMLENPQLFGLMTGPRLADWVQRDLLPEINILLRLAHPNLVRLRCVGVTRIYDTLLPTYLAMDFCGEGTLEQWIRDGRITAALAVAFVDDLVAVMTYLHVEKHVVHRDLKPANMFVRSGGGRRGGGGAGGGGGQPTLVVGDLGLAKAVAGTAAAVTAAGTPLYLAPDAAGGCAQCTLASDVYSASLVAVELVGGECVHVPATGARDAARAQRLSEAARAMMREWLVFADRRALTVAASDALLEACTRAAPADRATFRDIAGKCARVAAREARLDTREWAVVARETQLDTCEEAVAAREAALAEQEEASVVRIKAGEESREETLAQGEAAAAGAGGGGAKKEEEDAQEDGLTGQAAAAEAEAKARAEAEAEAEAKARAEAEAKARRRIISEALMQHLREELRKADPTSYLVALNLNPLSEPYYDRDGDDLYVGGYWGGGKGLDGAAVRCSRDGQLFGCCSIVGFAKSYHLPCIAVLEAWTYRKD